MLGDGLNHLGSIGVWRKLKLSLDVVDDHVKDLGLLLLHLAFSLRIHVLAHADDFEEPHGSIDETAENPKKNLLIVLLGVPEPRIEAGGDKVERKHRVHRVASGPELAGPGGPLELFPSTANRGAATIIEVVNGGAAASTDATQRGGVMRAEDLAKGARGGGDV